MNLGEGSVVFLHESGWSCAKESQFDIEFDIKPDKTAKKTAIIALKGLFNVIGEPKHNDIVEGVFMYDSGSKIGFKANILGTGKLIVIGNTHNDFETILNKISQWQEHFKAS